ncbi:inorganic phosphate transporter [candidate division KSB1 bacterium]|nr:inorganic phosphate transporter [candidate division KSB1 bacterium]
MELYLFAVVVLFGLAVSDLVVGVSNDAVNFLNSAIGSKVAPRWFIMIIASLGILLGVTFSSGMMEVARKGIFHPEHFIMSELIIIFLAVMLTDIILLDLFNTFGLPTSTTVSIVFELLGAAVAVSVVKIIHAGQDFSELINYINSAKALAIISGILLSIIVAFSFGAIIQFFTRLIFTFDFENRMKRYGGLWGGFALTAITYFILIKGSSGASFLSDETLNWIQTNTVFILFINFVFFTVIFQTLLLFTRINILKPIVIIGTGALAMAFAANDLVNFIGVPLAGFKAFTIAKQSTGDPLFATMEALRAKEKADTWMLLLAGFVMVVTLWLSKKARTVTQTEIGLGRQDEEGDERFESSALSRVIVRMSLSLSEGFNKITPISLRSKINKRFEQVSGQKKKVKEKSAFDLLRASTNLVVASTLISFATSLKLPLSTTYVTFMVAMGTSLSDRAWGRDSAVYRITGVLTVIGGWFFTAFMAFTVSLIFALLIYYFRLPAIILLLLFAVYFVVNTFILHKKREQEIEAEEVEHEAVETSPDAAFEKIIFNLDKYLKRIEGNYEDTFAGLAKQKREKLKTASKDAKKIEKTANKLVGKLLNLLHMHGAESEIEISPEILSALKESSRRMRELNKICLTHVENHHTGLLENQLKELDDLKKIFNNFLEMIDKAVVEKNIKLIPAALAKGTDVKDFIRHLNKTQLKRIRKGNVKTRQSLLYLSILSNTKGITDQFIQLGKGLEETKLFK